MNLNPGQVHGTNSLYQYNYLSYKTPAILKATVMNMRQRNMLHQRSHMTSSLRLNELESLTSP